MFPPLLQRSRDCFFQDYSEGVGIELDEEAVRRYRAAQADKDNL